MVIVPNFHLKGHDAPLNIGVVETDSYFSELGNHLAEKFAEEIDVVFIISLVKNRVSLRSIGDAINLAEIAKAYNGGGHPNASGCDLSELGTEFLQAVLEASKNK
jgi:DHHA1 domain.